MSDTEFTNEDFASMFEEMKKDQENGSGKSLYWKVPEGSNRIRILTPLKQFKEKLFFKRLRYHYINGKAYLCLNQTLTDKNGNVHEACPCPICAKSSYFYKTSQKGSEEWAVAGQLRAKDRYVSRIIVRGKKDKDGNDDEARPEFWEFGQKIHEQFFNLIQQGEVGNFLSLKDGRDYNLVRKGSGRSTSYDGSMLSVNQTPIFTDTEKIKKLLTYLPNMDYSQLIEFHSADELKTAMEEMLNGPATDPVQDFVAGGVQPSTAAATATPGLNDPIQSFMGMNEAPSINPEAEKPQPESIDDILGLI